MVDFDKALLDWNQATISELDKSTLLCPEDMKLLQDCLPEITRAFNHVQMFRTNTEMIVSVLNDVNFPTADSKYWQSVREMNAMVENLTMLSFTYKEKVLDLEELRSNHDRMARKVGWIIIGKLFKKTGLALQRIEIALKRKEFEIACVQREAHHRIREIGQWKKIQGDLLPNVQAGIEDVDRHQLFSLALRFVQEYYIAETGKVNKDLDSYRNMYAHLSSTLAAIRQVGLSGELEKVLASNPVLYKFVKTKKLLEE